VAFALACFNPVQTQNFMDGHMLFRPNRQQTLASFIPHPRNQYARAAGIQFVSTCRPDNNILMIAGRPKTGKTHLLHALAHFAQRNEAIESIACMSALQFTEQVMEGLYYKDLHHVLKRHSSFDLLVLDDLDRLIQNTELANKCLHLLHLRQATQQRSLLAFTIGWQPASSHPLIDFLDHQPAVRLT
jgi:chromosomal replication initiation ATPase DnaA